MIYLCEKFRSPTMPNLHNCLFIASFVIVLCLKSAKTEV